MEFWVAVSFYYLSYKFVAKPLVRKFNPDVTMGKLIGQFSVIIWALVAGLIFYYIDINNFNLDVIGWVFIGLSVGVFLYSLRR